MKNKEIAFSMAFVIFDDNSHKDNIKVTPGSEKMVANIIFSMMNGSMGQSVSQYIKKHYPNQFEEINTEVERLYNAFIEQVEELTKKSPNSPVISPRNVFGK